MVTDYPKKSSLAPHRDDEVEIVDDSIIACLSFGETRAVEIWRKKDLVWRYEMEAGSLYVMDGKFQSFLKHGVPQDLSCKGRRISITFRHLKKPSFDSTPSLPLIPSSAPLLQSSISQPMEADAQRKRKRGEAPKKQNAKVRRKKSVKPDAGPDTSGIPV